MSRRMRRRGVTLMQLLIGLIVLVMLLGLLLPAVQKVREAAARSQSQNNLRQIGIGVHNMRTAFEDKVAPSVGQFPAGGRHGTLFHHLLPYIEQDNLYRKMDLTANVKLYAAPADPTNPGDNNQLSYASNLSAFGRAMRRMFAALANKGESNVIIFCERYSVNAGHDKTTILVWGDVKDFMTFVTGGTDAKTVVTKLHLADDPKDFAKAPVDAAHCYTPAGCQVLLGDGAALNVRPGSKAFPIAINAFDNRGPAGADW